MRALHSVETSIDKAAVDLKYVVVPCQVVEVAFQGRTRRFKVESASPLSDDELLESVSALSLQDLQLWTVSWNTTVKIAEVAHEIVCIAL